VSLIAFKKVLLGESRCTQCREGATALRQRRSESWSATASIGFPRLRRSQLIGDPSSLQTDSHNLCRRLSCRSWADACAFVQPLFKSAAEAHSQRNEP